MKYVFIVNPTAGKKEYEKYVNNIKNYCEKNRKDYEIRITKTSGDATLIAKEYRKSKNIIYAVGGDGTLNEVLNGIIGSNNKVGVIPIGSGNDFYRLISEINETEFIIDVGKINARYFINIASFGMDAEIVYNTKIMKEKGVPAEKIYRKSITYTFLRYKFKKLEYLVNKMNKTGFFTIIAVCNGRYYGSGYPIAPKADFKDNLFDIYFVKKSSKILIPNLINKMKKGEHEKSRFVDKVKSEKIVIQSKTDIICNIDGEIIIGKKFVFEIAKDRIIIDNNQKMIKAIIGGNE